jgi:hypothetical protein
LTQLHDVDGFAAFDGSNRADEPQRLRDLHVRDLRGRGRQEGGGSKPSESA